MKTRLPLVFFTALAMALLSQCDKPAKTSPPTTAPVVTTAPAPAVVPAVPAVPVVPAVPASVPTPVPTPASVPASVVAAMAATPAPAPSSALALVTEGLSPSFRAVASHLELGGASFAYDEDTGTMKLAALLDRFMSFVPEAERKGLPPDFNVTKLFKILGLDSVTAKGTSARRRADGSYHSRSFSLTPGGRKGLLTLTGGPATKLMLLDFAPKDTDLALEFPLYLKDFARDVLGPIGAFLPAAERQKFDAQLAEPIPQLGVSLRDILEKTDARIGMYFRIDPTQKMALSPSAPEFPGLDGVIVIERLGWLLEKLKPQIVQMFADPRAPATLTDKGGVLTIRFNQPVGPPPMDYTPVFRFDAKADRLVIASRTALFDAVTSGAEKFSQRADFAEGWRDLPSEGNSCVFASSRLLQTATDLVVATLKAEKPSPEGTAAAQLILDFLKPVTSRSQTVVLANQADGILLASNASIPMTNSSMTTVSAVAVLASLAMPALSKVQQKAGQTKEINDAKQVIVGLKLYSSDHEGKYPAELSELIKAQVLDNANLLTVADPVTKERKPWLYNNKLNDLAPGTEPVLAAPFVTTGKRIVGFNDGSVRIITEEEFKKLRGEN